MVLLVPVMWSKKHDLYRAVVGPSISTSVVMNIRIEIASLGPNGRCDCTLDDGKVGEGGL